MSALNRYNESKHILAGGQPDDLSYRGVTEDESSKLIREGVTGGNLRGHIREVSDALSGFYSSTGEKFSGIYQQYTQDDGLVDAVIENFRQRGIAAEKDEIVIGSGATQLFAACCAYISSTRAATDGVILTETPFYHSFALTPPYYGLSLVPLRTSLERLHKLAPEDIRNWHKTGHRQTQSIQGVLLFSPTLLGEAYSTEELENLVSFFAAQSGNDHNLPLFMEDTVYQGISVNGDFSAGEECSSVSRVKVTMPDGRRINGADHSVVLGSLSKSYCAPNIRIGFARAPKKIAAWIRKYIAAHQVEIPRDHQFAAAVALRETPAAFFKENNREYRRRIDLVIGHLQKLNSDLRSVVSNQCRTSERLRGIFSAMNAIGSDGDLLPSFEFVSLYHNPSKANIIYLDFKNCSGIPAQNLGDESVRSPFITRTGCHFDNNLHLTRELMDRKDALGRHAGLALSPGWALGFYEGTERFICKLQIAQFAQPAAVESPDGKVNCTEVDRIFSELFLRMKNGLEEYFGRQP